MMVYAKHNVPTMSEVLFASATKATTEIQLAFAKVAFLSPTSLSLSPFESMIKVYFTFLLLIVSNNSFNINNSRAKP